MTDESPDFRRWSRGSKLTAAALLALVFGAPVAAWCTMIRMPGASYQGALPELGLDEIAIRDAAKAELDHLATEIGERNTRHPERLAAAASWIEAELSASGLTVARQTAEVDGVACANVEAERAGTSDEIVIVGAHYDSALGTAGANDNGSGVAALLALARAWRRAPVRRTVRFVAFVNEEPPYFRTSRMGSAIYAARSAARGERLVAMLSLETLGRFTDAPHTQDYPFPMDLFYPDRGDFIAFIGDVDSRALVRGALGVFRATTAFPSQGAALPEKTLGVGWSDHASFWDHDVPAIMVTDTALFRDRAYHTPRDSVDRVDVDRLARVIGGLRRVIEVLAQ